MWFRDCLKGRQSILRNPVRQLLNGIVARFVVLAIGLAACSAQAAPSIFRQPTNQVVAIGQTAMFNVGATGLQPLTYQWRKEGAAIPRATNLNLIITNVQPSDAAGYTVTVTDAVGQSTNSTQAVLIVFLPVSILDPPQSLTVLAGTPAQFSVIATGIPPPRYQWFHGNNPVPVTNDTLFIQSANLSQAGPYWVRVFNFASFQDSPSATLTVVQKPVILKQPESQSVLLGSNVVFRVDATGTAPLTYHWSVDNMPIAMVAGAANPQDLMLSNITFSSAGEYRVVVSNAYGTAISDAATLTLLAPARVITNPQSKSVPAGADVALTGEAAGTPPLYFQWYFGANRIAGANSPMLVLSNVTTTMAGEYRMAVSNDYGSDVSAPAFLSVGIPPTIIAQPRSQTNNAGDNVQFTVGAAGSTPLFYQWFFNGTAIPVGLGPSLFLDQVQNANEGTYRVIVSNPFGAAISDPFYLDVVPPLLPPLPFKDNFAEATPIVNAFSLRGSGSNVGATREPEEPLHDGKRTEHTVWLAWTAPSNGIVNIRTHESSFDTVLAVYVGNLVSSNALDLILSDDDSDPNHESAVAFNALAGVTYRIAVAGFWRSVGDIVFELDFRPSAIRLPMFVFNPPNLGVCFNSPADLRVDYVADENVQIQWLFQNAPLPNAVTISNYISHVGDDEVGRYRVRIVTPTATNFSRIGEIQINSHCRTNVFARDKFADAIDFGHYVSASPSELKKKPGGAAIPKFGSGAHGYSGSQIFSTIGSTSDPGEPNHCGLAAGFSEWFAYQAETNGMLRIDTEGSSFDTILAVYIGPGDSFTTLTNVACDDNSGSNGITSKVMFQATSNTIYWIAVDGKIGSSPQTGTVKLHMNLGNPISIGAQPQSQTVPSGTNVAFSVDANGMTNYLFQWRWFGTNLPGATGSNYARAVVNNGHAGPYDVVVRNPINAITSSVATLTVYSGTLNITNQPQSLTVTAGASASFTVGASGVGVLNYQWRFDGTNLPGATSNVLTLLNVQPPNVGTYAVNVTDANGSKLSSNATLTILSAPVITLQPLSHTTPTGQIATLAAGASGVPVPACQWYFNGTLLTGATAFTLNIPNFQGSNSGMYWMVASNIAGTAQTIDAELLADAPLRFTNLLTSNGIFKVRLIGATGTTYVIQWSTNNTNWVSHATNASSSGLWDFTEPWTNWLMRTYRARTPP
jgi:hypothetical protein